MADGWLVNDQDVLAQMGKEDTQARAQQNISAAGAVPPKAAVQALNQAPQTGTAPSLGMLDPKAGQGQVTLQNDTKNINESNGVADWFGKSVAHAAASIGASDWIRSVVDKAADYWGGPGGTFLSGPNKDWQDAGNAYVGQLSQDIHRQLQWQRGEQPWNVSDFFDLPKTLWDVAGGLGVAAAPVFKGAQRLYGQLPLADPSTGRLLNPQEREQASADAVNTALAGLTFRQKFGALTLRPPEPVPPREPGAPPPNYGPRVSDGETMHTDAQGNVMQFGSAKEAGIYSIQNPLPGNARYEIVTAGDGQYGLKIVPGEPDVVTEHPPGADPEADAVHVEEAKQAEGQVADMQETLAKESPFAESQTLVRELLADQGLDDKNVYIHAPMLADLHQNGTLTTQELMNLVNPENDRDIETHFWNAVDGQAEYAVPMSQYLAATNGKAWAGEVNKITRFSENGVSTADAAELNPEPPTEPEPFKSVSDLEWVAPKPGGTQPGGIYKDAEGTDWLVKGSITPNPVLNEDRARNEVLAGALMEAAIPGSVPEMRLIDLGKEHGGGVGIASKMNYDLKPLDKNNPEEVAAVRRHFAVQAWLANWDALGPLLDNTMMGPNGPVAIDLGGALRYRAMGKAKGSDFGNEPNEWTSMRSGGSASQQIYGGMTDQELLNSAAYLRHITPEAIAALVRKYGPTDPDENNTLWHKLVVRKEKIEAEAERLGPIPKPEKEVSEEEWKEIEDLLKEPGVTHVEPFQADPELSGAENEALKLELPGLQAAANQVANEVWLKGLFGDGQALGMTGKELEQWSDKVQKAQKAVYDRLLTAAKNRIKKFRTKEWKDTFERHLGPTQVEFYERPGVKTWVQLTTPQAEGGTDLVSGNALVTKTKPVRPTTFYRVTGHYDTGDSESFIDLFANPRAPMVPHPHWINTIKHSHYGGASFAEDPAFAENWAKNVPQTEYSRPITYVTHVFTPRAKLGDFRDPQDLQKAIQWWQKRNPQSNFESDQEYATRTANQKRAFAGGLWGVWEVLPMIQDLGWDAVRMLEKSSQPKDKPNLFVTNPNAIHWKYDYGNGVPADVRLLLSDKAAVPSDLLAKLPKGIWDKTGKPMEDFAAEVGFPNAQAMLEELADINTRRGKAPFKNWLETQIKAEAAMRAQDELGWDLSKASLLDAAREMVDTPMLEDLLTDSLKYLKERFGLAFDKDMILNEAKESFLQTPVKEAINIGLQERNLWRLMRKVEKGLVGTSQPAVLEAFKARQDALKAHYKLREALAFQKSYGAARRNWVRLGARATIKGLDQDFLNHIHASLATMQQRVNRQPDELLQSLNGQTTQQFVLDHFVRTSEAIVYTDMPIGPDGKGIPPEKMNVRDFKNVQDMIVSLRKVGRAQDRIYQAGQTTKLLSIGVRVATNADKLGRRYTPAKVREAASTSIGGSGKVPELPKEVAEAFKKGADTLAGMGGSLQIRPEVYLYYLDQNAWGPLSQHVTKVLQDARYYEDDLHKKVMKDLNEFYDSQPDGWEGTMKRYINAPGLMYEGTAWLKTRGHAVVALLNLGTMENMNKLLKGFNWQYEDVISTLENHLTKADVDFVQKIWDIHEHTLWPEVVKTYRDKEVSGVPPRKKQNRTFTFRTSDGHEVELRGGYYGIHYDSGALERMGKRNPASGRMASELLGGEYDSSAPVNNYTKSVTGFAAPMDLSFRLIPFRINQIIHDVSWRKPLIQAQKVLTQEDVVRAMQEVLGPEYPRLTKEWLQYIARQAVNSGSGLDKWANLVRGVRTNYISTEVLFKIGTFMLHTPIATAHMLTEGGPKIVPSAKDTFLQATLDFFRTPGQTSFWNNFINERSGEIRNIEYGIDRDVRDTVLKLERTEGPMAGVQKVGYSLFAYTKKVEARITWLTRYRQVMGDIGGDKYGKYSGGNEEAAIYLANKAVRDTQGAGSIMDLPPVLRGGHDFMGEVGKLTLTPFMGFRNATFNRGWVMAMGMRRVLEGRGTQRDWNMVGSMFGYFILPSLIWSTEQAAYRRTPDSLPSIIAQGVAHNTIGTMPLGDLATDLTVSELEGKGLEGERHSAQAQIIYATIAAPLEAAHLLDPNIPGPKEPVRAVLDAMGYYGLGIPDQFAISAQYATDMADGDQKPTSVGEALHNLAAGPPPKAKGVKHQGVSGRRGSKQGSRR